MRLHLVLTTLSLLMGTASAQGPPPVLINAPYVTTPTRIVEAMLQLAAVRKGDLVYDLGCGDGRIVIAAAKRYGVRGVGIDINPDRIREARAAAHTEGVEALVQFDVGDVFNADFGNATAVFVYLLPDLNLRLRPKLLHDLKPGTRVVSHAFDMGDWAPEKKQIVDGSPIYLWTIPSK
ncbi:MAG TPA: class I SAM-dependent methyltransferase [Bryobacteraceae bacterium]|jgi:SAM-dependent methyltransferase